MSVQDAYEQARRFGMMNRRLLNPRQSVFWAHIGSRLFGRRPRFGASSAIPWPASSRWYGDQKNTMLRLRDSADGPLRPPHAQGAIKFLSPPYLASARASTKRRGLRLPAGHRTSPCATRRIDPCTALI